MNLKRIVSSPLNIFLIIWILVISTFQLRVATFIQGYNIDQFIFPLVGIFYFSIGFILIYFLKRINKKQKKFEFYLSNVRFIIFYYFLLFFIIIIFFINLNFFGLPPFLSFFGYDTSVYLEYGRFKGLLFGLLIFLFLISMYTTKKLSIFMKFISILILLLYVSRGNIIFSILAYFFLLIYENKITNKKLVFISIFMIIFILVLFQILGEYRTGTEAFYNALEIKDEFQINNSGIIWLISYISMPFVNFLELTHHSHMYYGENIISRSIPAFLNFNAEAVDFYKSTLLNQYNTVSGYMGPVYLDFGLLGIIMYNFFLGLVLGYSYYFSKNNLIKSILITAIFLSFFVDYFFYFTTIVLIILSIIFNKFVLKRRYLNNDCINNYTDI